MRRILIALLLVLCAVPVAAQVEITPSLYVNGAGTARGPINGAIVTKTAQVCGLGDSLSNNTYQPGLTTLLGSTGWLVVDQGVAGNRVSAMATRVVADCFTGQDSEYLIVWGGINDVLNDDTAVNIEANLATIYAAGAAAGSRVVAVTISPFKTHVDWSAPRQAVVDAVNAWIVARPTNVDYVVDAFTALEDPAAADTLLAAYDSGDHLHPSAAGYAKVVTTLVAQATWTKNTVIVPALGVSGTAYVNQDLRIAASPTFAGVTSTGNFTLPAMTAGGTSGLWAGSDALVQLFQAAAGAGGQSTGQNVFVGHAGNNTLTNGAGATTLASGNTGVGWVALHGLTSGHSNTAMGWGSQYTANSGTENTSIGLSSGYGISTGSFNTAVGSKALFTQSTSGYSTAVGASALYASTGAYNTAVGYGALVTNGAGANNVGIGAQALKLNVTGNTNTSVGYQSLYSAVGTGNVAIGANAGMWETGSNAFYVDNRDRTNTAGDKAGALFYGTFNATPASQTLTINAILTLGAGTTPASSGTRFLCISTAGVVTSSATACSGT